MKQSSDRQSQLAPATAPCVPTKTGRNGLSDEHSVVSRETDVRLQILATLVEKWNPTLNLVSRASLGHLRDWHINDSLRLCRLMPSSGQGAIDLGSGAGFPGLVLAIATGRPFSLIESDRRKAAFLLEAGRQTDAPITVWPERIEAVRAQVDLVTARAVAHLHILVRWSFPLLRRSGFALFPKGRSVLAEIEHASTMWAFAHELIQSPADADSYVVKVWDIRHRPAKPTV